MRPVVLLLLLASTCLAQTSNGLSALETKIVNGYDDACTMTDLAIEFINDRVITCAQGQTAFFNGERRSVNSGFGVYFLDSEHVQNGYELTSCGCSQNGTWTRVMNLIITSASAYTRWTWKFYARRDDCSLELKRDLSLNGCATSIVTDECDCPQGYFSLTRDCACVPVVLSPIAIDLDGDGLELTSKTDGVRFDLDANGDMEQLPWLDSDDGWLVLNDKQDGVIGDGRQLFGNGSAQPESATPNGYRALEVFDDNGDGRITATDGVWRLLGIWRDTNHDGHSDGEVRSLDQIGIVEIDLDYHESRRLDRYGNELRYRSRIHWVSGGKSWSWDVFLNAQ